VQALRRRWWKIIFVPKVQIARNIYWSCGLIALVGILAYSNSLSNAFIFDDLNYIIRNGLIHNPWDWISLIRVNPHRVLTTWTFALNYAMAGLDPRLYHAVNILIHVACAWLVRWLVMLLSDNPEFGLWSALLFVSHPLQSMAVDQITQRYAEMGAFFYLLSLALYCKGRLFSSSGFIVASILAASLGIFCRETVITLPLAVMLCETFFINKRSSYSLSIPRWFVMAAFLGLGLGVLAIYSFNIGNVLGVHIPSESHEGEVITSSAYFLTQFRVILIYLRLMFWPWRLNFDYDMHLSYHLTDPWVLAGVYVVIVLLYFAYVCRKNYPYVSFAIGWFFITLLVESSIIPIDYVIAEYRLYLPLFGFCLGVVAVLNKLLSNLKLFRAVMTSVVVIFTIMTWQRNMVYKDDLTLWTDTVTKSPYKYRPYSDLAAAYIQRSDYENARKYLTLALQFKPDDYTSMLNLAQLDTITGHWQQAIEVNQKAIDQHPSTSAYNNLGTAYSKIGNWPKARDCYLMALELDRHIQYFLIVGLNLGESYYRNGQLKEAENIYLRMIKVYPDEVKVYDDLMNFYLNTFQWSKAVNFSPRILSLKNNDPEQLMKMAQRLEGMGFDDLARKFTDRANSFNHSYVDPNLYYVKY